MSEQESNQKAGTIPQEDGDAAGTQTTGTPVGTGRDADKPSPEAELEALRAERNLWLQNKSKVEEANKLREENEQLQRTLAEVAARPQPTYGVVDPRVAQQQQQMAELQAAIQEAQWEASQGDRKAALLVSLLNNQYQQQQYVLSQLKLQNIPAEDRAAVEKKLSTGRYADPDAAHEAVLGERWKRESASLKEREKEVAQTVADQKKHVVGTGRPIAVTAREMDKATAVLAPAEYAQEYDRIMSTLGPAAARGFANSQRTLRGDRGER